MGATKQIKTHRLSEEVGGCQSRGIGRGEIGEGGRQEVQTSSYKIDESWGTNIQCGAYRQQYRNNFVWGRTVTRLPVMIIL